jgi:hypothetical protein
VQNTAAIGALTYLKCTPPHLLFKTYKHGLNSGPFIRIFALLLI